MRAPHLLLASPLLLLLLACGQPPLDAHWRDRELRVDGVVADWAGLQVPLGGKPAQVGLANDGEALYVSVATTDHELARALAFGFTVWIDPAGGKAQNLGVRVLMAPPVRRNRWEWEPNPFPARLQGIELLGPQPSTRRRIDLPGEGGVEVALAAAEGPLVYELRVPLATAGGWGLGARPGDRLGVTLQSAPPSFGARRGEGGPDGDGPRAGRRPRGDGPEGDGPPRRGRGRGGPRPLELWVSVRLAAAP
jgi:hypothetical protein